MEQKVVGSDGCVQKKDFSLNMDDIYKTNVKTMSADLLKAIELDNEEPKDMISVETVRQWWADALDRDAWLHATTSLSMPFILTENPECRDCCFLSEKLATFLICNGNYESFEDATNHVGLHPSASGCNFMPKWFLLKCMGLTDAQAVPPRKKPKVPKASSSGENSSKKSDRNEKQKGKSKPSSDDEDESGEDMKLKNRKALQVALGRFMVSTDKDGFDFAKMFPMDKNGVLLPVFFKANSSWEGWGEKSTSGSASIYFKEGQVKRAQLESILKNQPGPWDGPNKIKNIDAFFKSMQKGCGATRKPKGTASKESKSSSKKQSDGSDDDDEDDDDDDGGICSVDEDEEAVDYEALLRVLKEVLGKHNQKVTQVLDAAFLKMESLVQGSGTGPGMGAGTSSGSDGLSNAERDELVALRAQKHEWEQFQQQKKAWDAEIEKLKSAQKFAAMTIGTALKNKADSTLTTMIQLGMQMSLPSEVAEVFMAEIGKAGVEKTGL